MQKGMPVQTIELVRTKLGSVSNVSRQCHAGFPAQFAQFSRLAPQL